MTNSIERIIDDVWNQVAADVYDMPGKVDVDVAVEICLDADRLEMFCMVADRPVVAEFRKLQSEEQDAVARKVLGGYF